MRDSIYPIWEYFTEATHDGNVNSELVKWKRLFIVNTETSTLYPQETPPDAWLLHREWPAG